MRIVQIDFMNLYTICMQNIASAPFNNVLHSLGQFAYSLTSIKWFSFISITCSTYTEKYLRSVTFVVICGAKLCSPECSRFHVTHIPAYMDILDLRGCTNHVIFYINCVPCYMLYGKHRVSCNVHCKCSSASVSSY